jgi:hypothetical protein
MAVRQNFPPYESQGRKLHWVQGSGSYKLKLSSGFLKLKLKQTGVFFKKKTNC